MELLKQNEKCIQTILNVIFFVELMTAKEIQCYDYQPKFLHQASVRAHGYLKIKLLLLSANQILRHEG